MTLTHAYTKSAPLPVPSPKSQRPRILFESAVAPTAHLNDRVLRQIDHCVRALEKRGFRIQTGLEVEFRMPQMSEGFLQKIPQAFPDDFYSDHILDGGNYEFRLKHGAPRTLLKRRDRILGHLDETIRANRQQNYFSFESRHLNISVSDRDGNLFSSDHPAFRTTGKAFAEGIARAVYDMLPSTNKRDYLWRNLQDRAVYDYSSRITVSPGRASSLRHDDPGDEHARLEVRTPTHYGRDGETEHFELLMLAAVAGAAYACQTDAEQKLQDNVAEAVCAQTVDAGSWWGLRKVVTSCGLTNDGSLLVDDSFFTPKRVTRICNKMGFDGYKELPKYNVACPALIRDHSALLFKLFNSLSDSIKNLYNLEIKNLHDLEGNGNPRTVAAMVRHVRPYLRNYQPNSCEEGYVLFGQYDIIPPGFAGSYDDLVALTVQRQANSPVFARTLADASLMRDVAAANAARLERTGLPLSPAAAVPIHPAMR